MRLHLFHSRLLILSFIFVCLCNGVQAIPDFSGRIILSINNTSVTASVDKPLAKEGELVTLTLLGLNSRQSAVVTAGLSAVESSYPVMAGERNTYTFQMPSSTIYINVNVKTSGYLVLVQTPGVGASLATVGLERQLPDGKWETMTAGTSEVAEGMKVRASLVLSSNPKYKLTLRELTGYALDGLWSLLPVKPENGTSGTVPPELTFTMPASDVVLRYMIANEAVIVDEPTEDTPGGTPVEVPEIAWPGNPGTPEKPVLVITKEIEEDKLKILQEELTGQLPVIPDEANTETISELVDISLQLSGGERVQPEDGEWVTVTYPFPQGTDGKWNFVILHLISDNPGEPMMFETIYPESLYIGLRFRVTRFSPFAIVYTSPVVPEGGGDPVRVTDVALSRSTLSMEVGGSESLTATLTPSDATDQRLVWSSSDDHVATVSAKGEVKALSAGTARITVRTLNGGFTASCDVTVASPGPEPTPEPDPEPPVSNAVVESPTPVWSVSDGSLVVTSSVPVSLRVHDASGRQRVMKGPSLSHRVALPAGLWLVRIGEEPACKIVIP